VSWSSLLEEPNHGRATNFLITLSHTTHTLKNFPANLAHLPNFFLFRPPSTTLLLKIYRQPCGNRRTRTVTERSLSWSVQRFPFNSLLFSHPHWVSAVIMCVTHLHGPVSSSSSPPATPASRARCGCPFQTPRQPRCKTSARYIEAMTDSRKRRLDIGGKMQPEHQCAASPISARTHLFPPSPPPILRRRRRAQRAECWHQPSHSYTLLPALF
jgi:hypothetical protein